MKTGDLMDRVVKLGLDVDSFMNSGKEVKDSDQRLMVKVGEAFNRSIPRVHVGFATKMSVEFKDDQMIVIIHGAKKDATEN